MRLHINTKKIPTPEFYVFYNGKEDYPENGFTNAIKICIEQGFPNDVYQKP